MPEVNLLSNWMYVVAGVLAVIAIGGGAFASWKTSKKLRGLFINALVLLLSAALLLLSAGLVLNKQNSWFSSLADLSGYVNSDIHQVGGDPAHDTFGKEPANPAVDMGELLPLPKPGERLQEFYVPTSVGQNKWRVVVVLPAEYFDPANAKKQYPVLMAAHGIPGEIPQWTDTMDIRKYGDPVVAEKKIAPFITVIPSLTPGGKDTQCVYGPGGDNQLEVWMSEDLPKFIKERFRVKPERTAWAWGGFSFGGWCAAMITMRHPDVFGGAFSLSGYFVPLWLDQIPWKGQQLKDKTAEYDLIAMAKNKKPPVAIWAHAARKDPDSAPTTQRFVASVHSPTAVTAVMDTGGGHTWAVWYQHLPGALEWMGKTLPGFAPQK